VPENLVGAKRAPVGVAGMRSEHLCSPYKGIVDV